MGDDGSNGRADRATGPQRKCTSVLPREPSRRYAKRPVELPIGMPASRSERCNEARRTSRRSARTDRARLRLERGPAHGAIDAFAGPQRKVVLRTPTFDLIGRFAEAAGAEVAAVPLATNYSHDLDAMAARVDERTGRWSTCATPTIRPAASRRGRALESFIAQLARDHSRRDRRGVPPLRRRIVRLLHRSSNDPIGDPRLIVTRSFSAIYGLAGMRVGICGCVPGRREAASFPCASRECQRSGRTRSARRARGRRLRPDKRGVKCRSPAGILEPGECQDVARD